MANPIVLASSAHAVLAVFARLKKKAGDTLRYEDIFHALGDAQIARTGQRQLSRKGLVIEYEHSLELTPIGYAAIALSDRHTRESHVSDPCAVVPEHPESSTPTHCFRSLLIQARCMCLSASP